MLFVIAQSHISARNPASNARPAEEEPMQSQNRFFDDLARVTAGALGTLSGVKSEVEARMREQLERVLASMDLVSRDEFEATKVCFRRTKTSRL
jgi:BMFP domain-containing protein YqiC